MRGSARCGGSLRRHKDLTRHQTPPPSVGAADDSERVRGCVDLVCGRGTHAAEVVVRTGEALKPNAHDLLGAIVASRGMDGLAVEGRGWKG